jgi:selenobiotic family peptide radical SAM maturase
MREPVFKRCSEIVGKDKWREILEGAPREPERLTEEIERKTPAYSLPPWLCDLARLELALEAAGRTAVTALSESGKITVNPSLSLLPFGWKGLATMAVQGGRGDFSPEEGQEVVMVWDDGKRGPARAAPATKADLLALKIVVEEIDREEAASSAGSPVGAIDAAVASALEKGLVIGPPSRIRRDAALWPAAAGLDEKHLVSDGFTLQWHITQACDLHCRHCYDRSSRKAVPFDKALWILKDLRRFCLDYHVKGHVSFTGGNPLLHPHFHKLYRGAFEYGFSMSILGNPAPREAIEQIIEINMPYLYQVSLEGLEDHNDSIRGRGHFQSVMEFLPVLKELGVSSMVMLTLTAENMGQIIPLTERLDGLVDDFVFNRLSGVGQGAALRLPGREQYVVFLERYLEVAERSSFVGLKDNLINILRYHRGEFPFGGCTGFGCGAAFNFISVLAEGEAHACRKFPSPIGNVLDEGVAGVYDSEAARRYRTGCMACRECDIRPFCGGCLAVAHAAGLDPLAEKDPLCFIDLPSSDLS